MRSGRRATWPWPARILRSRSRCRRKASASGRSPRTYKGSGPGSLLNCKDQCDAGGLTPYLPPDGFVDDMKDVTGISCDVVVRPFQWKGIASSIRHFVRDALDFHFSMQAVEKYGDLDCDLDGKIDEMTLGNVSALGSFVTMSRPPQQANTHDPSVKRGRDFFMNATPQACASCHVPSLPVYSKKLFIDDPGPASMEPSDCLAHPFERSLTSPNSAERSPVYSRLGRQPSLLAANVVRQHGIAAVTPKGLPCPARAEGLLHRPDQSPAGRARARAAPIAATGRRDQRAALQRPENPRHGSESRRRQSGRQNAAHAADRA